MDIFSRYSSRQLLTIGIIALLILALIMTLYLVKRQQEVRQRATGNSVSLNLGTVSPQIVKTVFDVPLTISASANNITGVDARLTLDKDVVDFVSFTPSALFNNSGLVSSYDVQTGVFRYAAVDTTSAQITGTVQVGILRLRGKAPGTANVVFSQTANQITALGTIGSLPIDNNTNGSYTIIPQPTNTPIPTNTPTPTPPPPPVPTATPPPLLKATPIPTPTPTPIPTNTPIPPSPTPIPGDINHDGSVNILDFNIWRCEFVGNGICASTGSNRQSDINTDAKVDLIDFSMWRNVFNP